MYFEHDNKSFQLVRNTFDLESKTITSYDYLDLHLKHLSLYDTTPSLNSNVGSITTLGGISISNTTDSSNCTNGGSITTLGGAAIRKKLYVGDNLAIGQDDFQILGSLHINQTTSSICLENVSSSVSYIDFITTSNNSRFGILSDSTNIQFSLTTNLSGNSPEDSTKALTINSDGFVGINTTTNINSPLVLANSNFISTNSKDGYLGLIAANTNQNDASDSARILIYGNDNVTNAGDIIISSGTSGSISLNTNDDNERLTIDNSGIMTIHTTTISTNSSSASLVLTGGMSIKCSTNSNSSTEGGALTIAGGAGVDKDFYIGGDLYVTGNINSSGSNTSPTIIFSNYVNCSFTGYDYTRLLSISNEAILTFSVWVTATNSSENTQFEFELPDRTEDFTRRTELIASCSGYTDDSEIIPLFNVICVAVKNTNRGLIKFQSVSNGIHYFTIICRYTLSPL
jgi:hypothetical protein